MVTLEYKLFFNDDAFIKTNNQTHISPPNSLLTLTVGAHTPDQPFGPAFLFAPYRRLEGGYIGPDARSGKVEK